MKLNAETDGRGLMLRLTTREKFQTAGGSIIVAIAGLVVSGWALIGSAVFTVAALVLLGQATREARLHKIEQALAQLDAIYDGRRYVGSDCVAISTRRTDNPGEVGPLCIEQLCRTRAGNWFSFRFEVREGMKKAAITGVNALTEAEARTWLESDADAYRLHFGEPELA